MAYTSIGSIDYSPSPQARQVVIALDNNELQMCGQYQIERFLRVWCAERAIFAPALEKVQVILVPSVSGNHYQYEGIQRFLQMYRDTCEYNNDDTKFKVVVEPKRL